jgi:alpha-tubulin suppressor-like RCC1 family protein
VNTVTLDSSSSSDLEGVAVTYAWSQTTGPSVVLSSETVETPSFEAPGLTPGTSSVLTFQLIVNDGDKNSTASTVDITVHTWAQVSAGWRHSLAVRSDGTLWSWGHNCSAQLGQGDTNCTSYQAGPTQVGTDTDWAQVSAGDTHSLAVKTDGTLWGWGNDVYGQTGSGCSLGGTCPEILVPTQIGSATDWVKAYAGMNSSYGLNTSNQILAWGDNRDQRLGLGSDPNESILTPSFVKGGAAAFSTSGTHSLFIDSTGDLWGWGSNASGQLGVSIASKASSDSPLLLSSTGNWLSVAAGEGTSAGVVTGAQIRVFGAGAAGALGLGSCPGGGSCYVESAQTLSGINAVAVSQGAKFGIALDDSGALFGWGANAEGELGTGDEAHKETPTTVGSDLDWAHISVKTAGDGTNHSLGLKTDGTMWAWGANSYGQVGEGTTSDALSPVRIGNDS